MEAVRQHPLAHGRAAREPNIDTDQIIPARFLTTTTRAGSGDALFADWRFDADGQPRAGFALNRPEAAGCADPGRRAQLRLRLLARARALGAASTTASARWSARRSPTSSAATRSRTACCRCGSTRRPTPGCSRIPAPSSRSISKSTCVTLPDGSAREVPARSVRAPLPAERRSTSSATCCRNRTRSRPANSPAP